MAQLVKLRKYVVVLRTKPDNIAFPGFTHARSHEAIYNTKLNKIVIDLTKMRTLRFDQSIEARKLLEAIWKMGRWTLVIDEAFYVQRKLGLLDDLEMLFTQSRSLGISIIAGMQRPVWTTRFALTEAKHVFSFRVDGRDVPTIKESTSTEMGGLVRTLPRYQFAHFYRPTYEVRTGEAHDLAKVLALG
jgi:hypothetical protein